MVLKTYGGGHYTRTAGGVWTYTATGEPVPGAIDLRIGKRPVMWAPELHPEALLNVQATAALLGIKPGSLQRMRTRGGPVPEPVLHVGTTPVWTVGVVEAWLRTRAR